MARSLSQSGRIFQLQALLVSATLKTIPGRAFTLCLGEG